MLIKPSTASVKVKPIHPVPSLFYLRIPPHGRRNFLTNLQDKPRSPVQSPASTSFPPNGYKPLSVGKCLSHFFSLKPVPYKSAKNATTSKSTRAPKFFDLHLHEDLRLKTVVVSEDLTRRISSICDQKVRALGTEVLNGSPSKSVEQVQAQGGRDLSRYPAVTELYDKASGLRPKLALSLDDSGRKERKYREIYLTL
jgi:hypothetical protein